MKYLFIRVICLVVFSAVLSVGLYSWGYLCGLQSGNFTEYDILLFNLTNNILISDALEIDEPETIEPMIKSKIELDFIRMAQLYKEHKFKNGEYLRCVISRRVRKFKENGQVMTDIETLKEIDFSIDKINDYLKTECLGEPSHTNWAKLK